MQNRILSGMRPTGALHLGHYHGVLKNWLKLQNEYDAYFFVADWHALTTHYADRPDLEKNTMEMVTDWLALGIDPNTATIFVQSKVPEHAELHVLLSMCVPLSWLLRVPSYKDQQEKLKHKDLSTYGFLGYPLLQSADILMYQAGLVPVGEDQVSHVELTREVARRFNHIFGHEAGFEKYIETALEKIGKKNTGLYRSLRKNYQEKGEVEALKKAEALVNEQKNITLIDRERLIGYLEGAGRRILSEPEAMLTAAPKMLGTDGRKMSKSYRNTISFRDSQERIEQKIKRMPTDPARIKRSDPGNPEKCPVWDLHKIYGDDEQKRWVQEGCTSAGIGCVECKQPIIQAIQNEVLPVQERIENYQADPKLIRQIIFDGSEKAQKTARETMREVREAMGLMD